MHVPNQKSEHYRDVESFMLRAGQTVPIVPAIPDDDVRYLRARLTLEETFEKLAAMGVTILQKETGYTIDFDDLDYDVTHNVDIYEWIDGCCDVAVVNTGELCAMGLPDVPFQREVNSNNLAKFGPGSYVDSNGKLCKPDNHQGPRIAAILHAIQANSNGRQVDFRT